MAPAMDEEDEEELQRACAMSLAPSEGPENQSPGVERDPKRSRADMEIQSPPEPMQVEEKTEAQRQRELRAAAAERRLNALQKDGSNASAGAAPFSTSSPAASELRASPSAKTPIAAAASIEKPQDATKQIAGLAREAVAPIVSNLPGSTGGNVGRGTSTQKRSEKLTAAEAERLYKIVFGSGASPEVLQQWSRQGFRFSADPSTGLGLVQKEGGPCGVLAPLQALLLKHLLYHPDTSAASASGRREAQVRPDLTVTDEERNRALVLAMTEALWNAGEKTSAVIASFETRSPSDATPSNPATHPQTLPPPLLPPNAPLPNSGAGPSNIEGPPSHSDALSFDLDAAFEERLRGVSLDSAASLSAALSVNRCGTLDELRAAVEGALPAFRSRLGALLFLFSALLSRGLDNVQGDRDDPEPPLVTRPFGHVSQEIVNLLLCGQAVSNVFDGTVDLGGGMLVKGIPGSVQVGFLTLLEGLNLCKVGYHLKHPQWPIWVIGSESHYTVLFALSTNVQEESDAESREEMVRRAFDAHDASDGGGFISPPELEKLTRELGLNFLPATISELAANEIILWQEFWQAACNLERSLGGFKGLSTPNQKRQFEVFHFNGIAKSVSSGGDAKARTGGGVEQRPRLTKLKVMVPPKWTPDEMLVADSLEALKEEEAMHAPLVDCIRSRWQRATCNWHGQEAPSIV